MNWNLLRNVAGEFEIGRVSLGIGVLATVITPVIFEFMDLYHNGWHFEVQAWCTWYPGGIVALVAGGLFSIGKKEKDIATARVTTQAAQ